MAKAATHQQQYQHQYQPQHPALPPGKPWQHQLDNGLVLRGEFIESQAGPSRPVLHFAHGNGMACRLYEAFLENARQHYAIFLHDSQGHGRSDNGEPETHPFVGWNASSKRLVEVIRAQQENGFLQGRRLIGSGHSFGGALTLLAAAKKPQLFESLILFDAMMFPPAMAKAMSALAISGLGRHSPLSKQARLRGDQWPSIEQAFSYFYQRGMLKSWHDDAVYSYLQHCLEPQADGSLRLSCPPWIESSIFAHAPLGLWAALEQLAVPTQLFYGSNSYPFIEPAALRAAKRNPQIQAKKVMGDHFFMLQNPNCLTPQAWLTPLSSAQRQA